MTENKAATSPAITQEMIVDYENLVRETKSGDPLQTSIAAELTGDGQWDEEFKAFLDSWTLKSLFFSEDWVFILVDLIAMKISSQQMKVMNTSIQDGKLLKEHAEGHEVQALIERPNSMQSYHSWMYCSIVDLILTGNNIQWYAPQANILMSIPSETILMDVKADGTLVSYIVGEFMTDGTGQLKLSPSMKLDPQDIAHLRRPNPSSLLWGLSPFIPGRKSVLFNRYSSDYLISFYRKGAIPGFALELEKEANEKTAMRLLRSFDSAYVGRRNMRRTMVIPKGVNIKELSPTLANQELAVYIDKNRENIINILKVPKHELSLQESGSLGSEETKAILKNFWYATLIPMMRIVEGEFTKFFRSKDMLSESQILEFDLSEVEALQDDESKKADLAKKKLDSGWSINEVRTKIWELPAYDDPDADRPFVLKPPTAPGFGQGLALSATPQPQQLLAASDEPTTLAEDNLYSDAPADPEVIDVGEDKAKDVVKQKAAQDKIDTYLKAKDGWFDKREAKVSSDVSKGVSQMERLALTLFADMAATVIKTTRGYLQEKNWDLYASKADPQGKPAKLVKVNELRRRLRKALDRFEDRWIGDVRQALLSRIETGYNAAIELPFNLPSKNELAGLRARGAAARQDALESRAGRVFGYMNETTINKVFSTIEKGIEEGKTVQQISDDLKSRFTKIEDIGSRAMTIARTETLTAVSLGQAAAMKDAATIVPDLQKMWITANDERVRESHNALHGDIVGHDKAFDNNLFFPRDPAGPPEEVINCRCTWIMVPKDQMSEIDDTLLDASET